MNIMNQKVVLLVAGIGALALGACNQVAPTTEADAGEQDEALSTDVCPAGVPTTLAPAADQSIKGALNAVGVQVYMCTDIPNKDSTLPPVPTWTLVNPQANLMKDSGHFVGTHFIGPTWQGNDGSTVVGSKVAGATVDSTAIPWLLLTAKSHADEDGFFRDVTSIQRLATVGGLAPSTPCDATTLGTIYQSPYSAEYVFYKTKTKGKITQCNGS